MGRVYEQPRARTDRLQQHRCVAWEDASEPAEPWHGDRQAKGAGWSRDSRAGPRLCGRRPRVPPQGRAHCLARAPR